MSLPLEYDEQLAVALAAERAKVERDEAAAFDGPSRSSATAGRRLLGVHEENAAAVRASGDIAAAQRLYRDISAEVALPSMVVREADLRSFTGRTAYIAGGIAKDAGEVVGSTLENAATVGSGLLSVVKISPFLLAALALFLAWRMLPRWLGRL